MKIIAATNVEPLEAIEKGQLRRDIYYRLSLSLIHILSIIWEATGSPFGLQTIFVAFPIALITLVAVSLATQPKSE